MGLGIRRKLIGTLILVGLFPLAMSLIVILVGGAAMQLSRIRNSYEQVAAACSKDISTRLLDVELDRLEFVGTGPQVMDLLRARMSEAPPPLPPATIPSRSAGAADLDARWDSLKEMDSPLKEILANPVSQRLRDLTSNDLHPRRIFVTDAKGELVAADVKTDDFFQADEEWWQQAYNNGKGRLYVSSLVTEPDKTEMVEIAMPIYGVVDGKRTVIGIIKDKLASAWLLESLTTQAKLTGSQAQLIDLDMGKTIYASAGADVEMAERFFLAHQDYPRMAISKLLLNKIVLGSSPVEFNLKVMKRFPEVQVPRWVLVVSKPSQEAMTPVYRLALTVAAIGVALILVLFILGVAISNREIIMPILRLREATAAVGRGELNVRLLSADSSDATFRKDELGDLARDFDEMTRQLQKNVNQLARSNEAKRRFMELAGHELRTPVTYLLGVCQLAQKQIQQLSGAATDGAPEDAATVALAAKNAAATQAAMVKIAAKTQRLSRIIDNLLKLVNNDQFTTKLNKEPVDMRALLLQVTSDHRPFIQERKQQLTVEVAENLPSIEADRDKLEDALTNLVSNAIRFSPDGGTVRVAAHEVTGDMLEILVEDSGPGIPAQDLANLFEPFYTGSDILQHHSGTFEFGSKGIGLGLAIVRRFIELHGGIVRAHAIVREGKTAGTQFQILLPLAKEDGEVVGTAVVGSGT
ncbi:MAG TPA: ATP-binding protein [Phycisphaerae bacterium]|nr:ATP-binding protein [Phycisphaerae bacterium]